MHTNVYFFLTNTLGKLQH